MNRHYRSKQSIETTKQPSLLIKEATRFVTTNTRVHSKALKRKINLSKIPEALDHRRSSRTKRLRCFIVAVDILKNSPDITERIHEGRKEYAVKGYSSDNFEVEVHIREEISASKDKELFMVSCFYK